MIDLSGIPRGDNFKLEAQGNTIIVEVFYDCKLCSDLIFIPEKIKEENGIVRGKVMSVGPDFSNKDMVKPGCWVIFRRHEGVKINESDEKYYLSLKEKWVDAIEEE